MKKGIFIILGLATLVLSCDRDPIYNSTTNSLFSLNPSQSSDPAQNYLGSINTEGAGVAGGGPSNFNWHLTDAANSDLGIVSTGTGNNFNADLNPPNNILKTLSTPLPPGSYFVVEWDTGSSATLTRTFTFYNVRGEGRGTITIASVPAQDICRLITFPLTGDTFQLFHYDGTSVSAVQIVL